MNSGGHGDNLLPWLKAWGENRIGAASAAQLPSPLKREDTRGGPSPGVRGSTLPCFVDLVLTLYCGKAIQDGALACLCAGRPKKDLAASIGDLLCDTLETHCALGGSPRVAEHLVLLFRAAFPDPSGLQAMSGLAQVFLIGVSPRRDETVLKVYLNPRVSGGDPRARLEAMADAVGLHRSSFTRGLDTYLDRLRRVGDLYGVGFDLGASSPPRAKLYFRLPRCAAGAFAREHRLADSEDLESWLHPRHSVANQSIDQVELALAWSESSVQLKLTEFFDGRFFGRDAAGTLLTELRERGFAIDEAAPMLKALRASKPTSLQRSALRALGVEFGAPTKINLYLQPEV